MRTYCIAQGTPLSAMRWPTQAGNPKNKTVVQSLNHVRLFVTPWTTACQASLSITDSWSLLKLTSMGSVMPSNHLILSILMPPSPPALNLSRDKGLVQSVISLHQVGLCIGASAFAPVFSMSCWVISFRNDWFDFCVSESLCCTP